MSDSTKGHLLGILFILAIAGIGIYIILAGLGSFRRSPNDAPGWVLIVAGAAFLFAAASFGLNAVGGIFFGATAKPDGSLTDDAPYAIRFAQILLSLSIVALLGTVATWVAFNPAQKSGIASKVAFAAGAASIWLALFGFAIWKFRRLKR